MLRAASTALAIILAPMAVAGAVTAQAGTAAPAPASAEDQAFAKLIADYEAYERGEDPFTAGSEGDKKALAQLPDFSRAAEIRRGQDYEKFAQRLAQIDASKLSTDEGRMNHAFMGWVLKRAVESVKYDGGRLAFDSEGGP